MHFGRIGTDGQIKTKRLASPEAAKHELEKLIREKLQRSPLREIRTAARGAGI